MPRRLPVHEAAIVPERRAGLIPVALCLLFGMPLAFGLLSASSGLKLTNRASHFAHDVASMYRQGVDFSRPESQSIIFDLARAQDLPIRPENAVVIVSTVRKVSDADCAASSAGCVNRGQVVLQRQVTAGNPRLHASSFGTVTGRAATAWLDDRAAQVKDFGDTLRPGEVAWVAETWFAAPNQAGGVYVRTVE
ncbi:MAG TPA: hypothetical protein VFA04_20690 [Bryobacteraceae bacterium]|nr:hypothetical protein [Bryobacteraceae bacterium]